MQQQAIPSIILFLAPLLALSLLCIALSRLFCFGIKENRKSRVLCSLLAISFLGVLSAVIGTFGIVFSLLELQDKRDYGILVSNAVFISLLRLSLGLSMAYFIATAFHSSIIVSKLLVLHNIIFIFILVCASVLYILAVCLEPRSLPILVPPILALASTVFPIPLLCLALATVITNMLRIHHEYTGNFPGGSHEEGRFAVLHALGRPHLKLHSLLLTAQMCGVASTSLDILESIKYVSLDTVIPRSILTVLWTCGIMVAFHYIPSILLSSAVYHTQSASRPTTPRSTRSAGSDFLNLQDPFASPPLGSVSLPSFATRSSVAEKLNKEKERKSAQRKGSSQTLLTISRSTYTPSHVAQSPEDIDFGTEDALLAEMLLRSLDSELRSNNRVGLGLGFEGENPSVTTLIGRDSVRPNRFTQGSAVTGTTATLYETSPPSSPLTPNSSKPLPFCKTDSDVIAEK